MLAYLSKANYLSPAPQKYRVLHTEAAPDYTYQVQVFCWDFPENLNALNTSLTGNQKLDATF